MTLPSRAHATLVVLCLLLWLPGFFSLPPGDRDESRFAQASRQMLESGDLLAIRNGAEARNRKPIGIYWLQLPGAALVRAAGVARDNPIWPYRLPSLAGGLIAVLATAAFGRRAFGARAGLLAGAMLAASLLLTAETHIASTDAALLGATTIAMTLMGEAYLANTLSAAHAAGFWVALAAGVLLKGPVAPMVACLAAATLVLADRRAGWLAALRPGWGAPLAAALILPWFVAIGLATGGGFFREALEGDLGAKFAGGAETHGAPPGTHLLLLSLTLFPSGWAVLCALPAAWAARRAPASRFLLAWAVPSWLVFEAVPTKLAHYPLPLAPALLLLAAAWLVDPAARPAPRWLAWVAAVLFALAAAALGFAAAFVPAWLHLSARLGLPALAAVTLLAALVLHALLRGKRLQAGILGVLAAAPLYAALFGFELPRLAPLWIAPRVAAALAAHPAPGGLAVAGFAEPSLRFACGTATRVLPDAAAAAAFLAAAPGRAALVAAPDVPAFKAAAAELHVVARARDEIDGYDYAAGRFVALRLFAGP